MAAPQSPSTTTTRSACIPNTARSTHVFTVAGYRLHKGIGVGNFIRPICHIGRPRLRLDYVSVFVELQTKKSMVRALYDLRLTNWATGLSSLIFSRQSSFPAFDSRRSFRKNNHHVKGQSLFMKRDLLEASPYLKDDCIVIECDVTVLLKEIPTVATATTKTPEIQIVLAMRSPVIDAELYGPMAVWDKEKQCVQIVDMQPAVFGAFLHFIYTDSLPAMDDLLDSHDKREVIRHLLVAADRYAMDRLKLMCEAILCKGLDAESVAATLALADQHGSSKLRDACMEYIKLFT
ncbi:BTB/POZ and MATH domain-containing protein 1-like [Aegilops tauschii subsp. strangulata]|uniref:Speckle-type POZ protein-like protein n=1 Tax=Aegilops tauschii TaxID=37682 RepID=M8BUH3_AEGTA